MNNKICLSFGAQLVSGRVISHVGEVEIIYGLEVGNSCQKLMVMFCITFISAG